MLLPAKLSAFALVATALQVPDAGVRADALVAALQACRSKPDTDRLSCFDDAVDRLLAARANKDIRVVDREAVMKAKRSLFGFAETKRDPFGDDGKPGRAEEAEIKEVSGAITRINQLANGLWIFSFAEGGTWQTLAPSMMFTPRVGNKITVKAGLLGHYTARIDKGRSVDVKRLR